MRDGQRVSDDASEIRRFAPGRAIKVGATLGAMLWGVFVVGLFALVMLGKTAGPESDLFRYLVSAGLGGSPPNEGLHFLGVLPYLLVVGIVVVLFSAVAWGIVAVLYNSVAELTGGLRVQTKSRD